MMEQSRGMILFTTLMMISWVALMVLSGMRAVLLWESVNSRVHTSHQAFYALDLAAHAWVDGASEHALQRCARPCQLTYEGEVYQYEASNLGVFPCLTIQVGEIVKASHHWQVRFWRKETPQKIIEIRLAMPGARRVCRLPINDVIRQGVISWRYVTSKHVY